jgi:hypothetical protein
LTRISAPKSTWACGRQRPLQLLITLIDAKGESVANLELPLEQLPADNT